MSAFTRGIGTLIGCACLVGLSRQTLLGNVGPKFGASDAWVFVVVVVVAIWALSQLPDDWGI